MTGFPQLVLLHGHGVDASIWDDIYVDLLVDDPVQTPDFAELTHYTTIEAYADELNTRLQAASVGDVVLVGHSMGGYIALAFADRHPTSVRGLVLYHSTAYADDETRKEQRRQIIETMKVEGGSQFIEKQLPKMVGPDYPSEKIQALIDRFRNLPTDALIVGMEAIAGRPDQTHVLRNANFPVLLVLGKEDQLIPFDKTQQLADLSDQVSVATIDHAGHLSMVEQPEASVEILRTFMTQVKTS